MAHKRKTLFPKIGKESAHNPNVQPFYSWSETHRFCTALRQVSRLIDHRIHLSSQSPSDISASLPNYGDEFVQELHLFPFSPEPDACAPAPTPDCYIFSSYQIYHTLPESTTWNQQKPKKSRQKHLTAPLSATHYIL